MERQIICKIINQGHEYAIYSDGHIEGFGSDAVVFNYFPSLLRECRMRWHPQLANQQSPVSALDT